MRKLYPGFSFAAMTVLMACSSDSGTEVNSELPPNFSKPSPESANEYDPSSSSVVSDGPFAQNASVATGTLVDERDGRTYKTVKIGDQVWMAENLNYKVENSFCYEEEDSNCAKYGQLYLWSVAMDSAGIFEGNSANGCGFGTECYASRGIVRGVCPAGWHLPSKGEFETLFKVVGGKDVAGTKLASASGWNDFNNHSLNGTDDYSFSALPGGYWYIKEDYSDAGFLNGGYVAAFWSSTEQNNGVVYGVYLIGDYVILHDWYKHNGLSVRCIRD